MRADVFHNAGAPLTIEQVTDPQVSRGDLVIAVRRSGNCVEVVQIITVCTFASLCGLYATDWIFPDRFPPHLLATS